MRTLPRVQSSSSQIWLRSIRLLASAVTSSNLLARNVMAFHIGYLVITLLRNHFTSNANRSLAWLMNGNASNAETINLELVELEVLGQTSGKPGTQD